MCSLIILTDPEQSLGPARIRVASLNEAAHELLIAPSTVALFIFPCQVACTMSSNDEKVDAVDVISNVDKTVPADDPDADLSPDERKKKVGPARLQCGELLTSEGTRTAVED